MEKAQAAVSPYSIGIIYVAKFGERLPSDASVFCLHKCLISGYCTAHAYSNLVNGINKNSVK